MSGPCPTIFNYKQYNAFDSSALFHLHQRYLFPWKHLGPIFVAMETVLLSVEERIFPNSMNLNRKLFFLRIWHEDCIYITKIYF
ncbi:hypothetical protein Mfla_1562 [Methylobacillus flagellatus KT]|uniref:Uncharacterized protein n=1 Tax=Methylobacillus flagellatus (strain ATCC 51484 / DSM 6875 / VKM B-1610 / KT) TaxID=265072 RepID=Q1H107_METFK|nr:hypothetical protein Mfla_1562 [Methylobacillus flagellatus KT]